MSKPGKVLKALCKKLGIRLTVKRGKKRVYKSVAVLKRQCKRKKKKKKKVKRKRKRKFGMSPTLYVASRQQPNPIDYEIQPEELPNEPDGLLLKIMENYLQNEIDPYGDEIDFFEGDPSDIDIISLGKFDYLEPPFLDKEGIPFVNWTSDNTQQEQKKVAIQKAKVAIQKAKEVSAQTGIPYKKILMYILGAGALGGGAYVGHRYYKKRKGKKKKGKRK